MSSDHVLNYLLLCGGGGVKRGDELAIAEHSDPIRYLKDFVEPMGDEDNPCATGSQLPHYLEEPLRLLYCECRCGLIHDQYPGSKRQSLSNFDELPFSYSQRLHRSPRIDIHLELAQQP